ncbi:hypothetical protein Ait01nite_057900 [Actinoplanes italicus]|uniref:Uncharacterized protein DUF3592 n=1 Tax=Actinoplanes italicus TaxID=113567 RepID=A0A2T0K5T4_9ACTN|nr:DUF3592 domain-containing protein [Actinoplanes italicus]PRX18338.1 uncharacterized protein DUF3592 [Actinoplanes italicus]GIE32745.1 hypothetical protein Ait01nite_057900 [Actinoplanes italicus]
MTEDPAWLPYVLMAFLVGVPAMAGVLIIVVAARRWFRLRRLATEGRQATARVVDNQQRSGSGHRIVFRPVVVFRTDSDQEVTTVLPDLTRFESHVIGTEITVYYDERTPAEAVSVGRGNGGLIVAVVLGLIFLGFAVLAYRLMGGFGEFGEFGGLGGFG